MGRWDSGDPANQFFGSPYTAMANNPVLYADPDGRIVPILVAIGAAVIGGASNVYGHWDKIGSLTEGLDYFTVGAVSGAVAVVNPLAGGAIAAGGNAMIDLMHGRTPDITEAVMDFGYTFIGGKGTQQMIKGLEAEAVYQAGRTILRDAAILGEEQVVLKDGVKNAMRNADGTISASTRKVGESVIEHVNMKTVEVSERVASGNSLLNRGITEASEVLGNFGIPKSYVYTTNQGQSVFVSPHAMKHLEELAANGAKLGPDYLKLFGQTHQKALHSVIDDILSKGPINFRQMYYSGGNEIMFGAPRTAGELPAVIHFR